MKKKSLDNTTVASSPGNVYLSIEKLKLLSPSIFTLKFKLLGYILKILRGYTIINSLEERVFYGDSQPAIVISTTPLIIAAYSEDIDCVVLIKFPDKFTEMYNLYPKSKLISINTYLQGNEFQKDLSPGDNCHYTWVGYTPIIGEFITNNLDILEEKKSNISEDLWEYVYKLGLEYSVKYPNTYRNYDPLFVGNSSL